MFNKRLLVSIVLDKKKLEKGFKESCVIECIPTVKTLSKEEKEDLVKYLKLACDLLRTSYVRYINNKKLIK